VSPRIEISLASQALRLLDADGRKLAEYRISSAKQGAGEQYGSFCTPRGAHLIRAKIGTGAAVNTVFVKRRPTGEIYTPELGARYPGRDWILTRILWLSGCEPGINRLGKVDTMRRYIYIHGSPDSVEMGTPGSIGCIRMRNADLLELFEAVIAGTRVEISEN
jgi:lipoprotein-anchoring transpeptidase ErfK/SrfK